LHGHTVAAQITTTTGPEFGVSYRTLESSMTSAASTLQLTKPPVAIAEMLIRKPVADVFEAFVDPAITSKFWFTKGSGRLEPGAHVQWDWEMYNHSVRVDVKEIEPNKRILIEWPGYSGLETVEWRFTPLADDTTFVSITNSGFRGNGDEMAKQATDATEAFTMVLAGLKAYLEHGVVLNLVADRFPEGFDAQ
jgi:uncharacterized protein YndB with AHSA1/START domain